jgi:hypothetical protein
MINIKKINLEFILSITFFLLLLYTTLSYTYPILKNMNIFSNIIKFEVDATWGKQLELTQSIVIVVIGIFVAIMIILRLRKMLD